ncbi:MAG: hypothetical protein AAGC55_10160 [Myxococcota bacterium]
MSFRIRGLSPAPFRHFVAMPADELAHHRARRCVATPGSSLAARTERAP